MTPIVVNGWVVFAHPLLVDQIEALAAKVEQLRGADPHAWETKNSAKRLAAIVKLALDVIPADPSRPEYRQGTTLGDEHKHWLRAKFCQQYGLLFRYHRASKIIVYAWLNDEMTRGAHGGRHDAYRVFGAMLSRGQPPASWDVLLREARAASGHLEKAGTADK